MTIHKPANAMNNVHIGASNAWLKSCVNWFARLTYSLTMSPVKQSVSLLVLPGIAFIFLFSLNARAEVSLPKDFFNFGYAKTVWSEFSGDELDAFFSDRCPDNGIYDQWEKSFKRSPQQALQVLEGHKDAKLIRRCHDVVRTYEQWSEIYKTWRKPLKVYGSEGWNKNKRAINCMVIASLNIFTGQCNDLPDWRLPKNVKEDNARMAKGNARWLSKNK
ncbi:MAG: hypothetical protein JKY27_05405 [Magnetovibrio sp.]|nr:hypothetical protein [Magnetovibrio sp.]